MPTSELPASSLPSVATALQQAVDQVASPDLSFGEDINHLAARLGEMAKAMVAHGDGYPYGPAEDVNDPEGRITHFVWAEQAKHFLILYRNVQLQLQTADLMVEDEVAEPGLVQSLHLRSRQTLNDALSEWESTTAKSRKRLGGNAAARKKALNGWKVQHNPWPAYRQQLLEVATQAEELAEEFTVLSREVDHFASLRKLLHESIAAAEECLQQAVSRADEVLAFMADATKDDAARPGRIATRLEESIAEARPGQQIHDYTNQLNVDIQKIVESIRVTVGAEHGMLRFKDVNLRRSTNQWISAEVLPHLYELWGLSEQITSGLSVAVNNVRNRSLLIANELRAGNEVDYQPDDFSQPFYDFLARTKTSRVSFSSIRDKLAGLIDADLKLTSIYRPAAGFLPLPLQTGLSEFTRRQGRWVQPVRDWFNATFRGLERWRGDAAREDRMSVSEKLVRVITQRRPDPANVAYTNILLTKGYIGESFLVGREEETAHLRRLIEQWRDGFRGAVVLTGQRLSGKSLFGEMISNQLFPNNVVRLAPNATISVQGRRMTTTGKLADALAFVQKNSLRTRPMIWIDDLELWWDNDTSLAENVRALSNHIDNYSNKIFYLVATTNGVYDHLNRFRDFDRVFQAEVNLDGFSVQAMQMAIRIRHGATHKLLVGEDGEPLGEIAFDRLVVDIHRSSQGNVGDSLNRWAYQMLYCGEERVTPSQQRRHKLPAFLSADTGILLTTIFLERRTNEYHLRRLFGPAFDGRYRNVLQRLLRVGLLVRANDGWLSIHESVVTDLGRALKNNGYLNTNG
jgi:hypothetical protein